MVAVAAPPLAHRDADLTAVDDAWAQLADRRPGMVVVEGPRGIGKTALLTVALSRLPAPAVVLKARCTAAERDFAFGTVEQLFERTDVQGVSGLQGYLRAARDLADSTPVVIAIDDVQHADAESLEWLGCLARRIEQLHLAVIVTVDEDAPQAAVVRRIADDVAVAGFVQVLRPEPLCATCVEGLAAEQLGGALDAELAVACHTLSSGNPLILREFVRRLELAGIAPGVPDLGAVLTTGAATLADTTLTWLEQRSPAAAALLGGIALLGRGGVDLSLAASLVGQGEIDAADSLRVLLDAGVVEAAGGSVHLVNAVVREAALSRLAPDRRTQLHLAAAQLLHRDARAARRAADHLVLVGATALTWTRPLLRSAAREAQAAGEVEAAVRYLRRAMAEPGADTADVLSLDVGGLELHHDLPSAMRRVESALPALRGVTGRADGLLGLASPVLLAEGESVLRPFAETAHGLTRGSEKPPSRHLAFGALAALGAQRPYLKVWTRALSPVGTSRLRDDSPERGLLGALAALTAAAGLRRGRTMRLARRSADGAMDFGAASLGAVLAACWAEEFPDAQQWATWAADAARSRSHRGELALALLGRALVLERTGDLAAALDDARAALTFAARVQADGLLGAAAVTAARLLLELGQPQQAETMLDTSHGPLDGHPLVRGMTLHVRGLLAAASGDHRHAAGLFVGCGHALAARGIANPACVGWRASLVAAHVALEEPEAARTIAAANLDLARRWGAPGLLGLALMACSSAETGAAAVAYAVSGLTHLARSGLPLEHGRAVARLADLHRAGGDEVAADDLLRASGERSGASSSPAVVGPVRLTVSETRVTDLVLQGMTNQEVADALCISRRTVDTHLNRIYRKLSISSRAELGPALGVG